MRKKNDPLIGRLALLVASGRTVTGAAKELGVLPRTAGHWSRTTEFRGLVAKHRARITDRTIGRLVKLSTLAVEALAKLVVDGESAAVRLGAARTILDQLVAITDHAEHVRMVAELRSRLDVLEGTTNAIATRS